ncbi:MAG: sodium-dependent bicarbonate transport family permease, partial [Chlamydiae bacterium]|nr:sodium-dependent bicarbonate transport family permease [Chlamydiota bacterium]
MNILNLLISNLASIPILSFGLGILISNGKTSFFYREKIKIFLTISLLFFIGLKGGGALLNQFSPSAFSTLFLLVVWGFIQPLL